MTPDDVAAADNLLASADTVSVQLQQPAATAPAAVRRATAHGARVVADSTREPDALSALLPCVDVLRADAREAEMPAGEPVTSADQARDLAGRLLDAGPDLVALAVPEVGDLVVTAEGSVLLPLADVEVVDPTGAGDAFTAGLVAGLHRAWDAEAAAHLASSAAAATVRRLGGRPDLSHLRTG